MPSTISLPTTLLFLSAFILAFFPSTFISLLSLPLSFLYPHRTVLLPPTGVPNMSFFQKTFTLPPRTRGSYLVTPHIVSSLPELKDFKVGILHLFVQHTSCALSLNENWDEDVRADMSDALDRIVPEDKKGTGLYRHDAEGADDMPAHVKSALIGTSVTIPISDGKLATGTWQGIWYLEFRDSKNTRRVVATIQGEKK
ncbi:hypothetical protein MMC34_002133 [Xylographa carneopallida]|nr:hypothetical protein [Xylographa carneopallida]